jgi:hypothetical protein
MTRAFVRVGSERVNTPTWHGWSGLFTGGIRKPK